MTVKDAPAPLVEIKVEQASRREERGRITLLLRNNDQKTEKAVASRLERVVGRGCLAACRPSSDKPDITDDTPHRYKLPFRVSIHHSPFTSRCVLLGLLVEQSIHAVRIRQVARSSSHSTRNGCGRAPDSDLESSPDSDLESSPDSDLESARLR